MASSAGGEQLEEAEQQRKALHELREVLRFMKKEKDMLLAKLSVVESENSRHLMEVWKQTMISYLLVGFDYHMTLSCNHQNKALKSHLSTQICWLFI